MLTQETAAHICKTARLSASQSRVFTLYTVERLSFGEIAARMERSESTVKTQFYRAQDKIVQGQRRYEAGECFEAWLLHEALPNVRPYRPATPQYTNVASVGKVHGVEVLTGDRAKLAAAVVTVDDLTVPGLWRRVLASPEMVAARRKSRRLKAPRDRAQGGLFAAEDLV